ncbi:hypothetical protein L1987_15862 [Smallanthus sonchifolius]|uniref:Uncharacterized protein n=1 Tax=Smallanthus sonchifolius TaxID=185202 RepID=A0ACB9J751_9ASTR|nr:hypothetical protein L1987_15862 [Smallanthus sonchifolius]
MSPDSVLDGFATHMAEDADHPDNQNGWIEESEEEEEEAPLELTPVTPTADSPVYEGEDVAIAVEPPRSTTGALHLPSPHSFRESPRGALFKMTARKSVSPVKKRKMDERENESATVGYIVERPPQKTRAFVARRWGWLSERVQEWTNEEGVPNIRCVGESSSSRVLPLTGQPIERTVPLLAARCAREETRMDSMGAKVDRVDRRSERIVIMLRQ